MADKKVVLDGFLGVDVSNSEYEISSKRATEINNLINIAGINHKRKGFVERMQFTDKINGIYNLNVNGREIYIVHAGNSLYECSIGINSITSKIVKLKLPIGCNITDEASWGIVDNSKLYLLCGDYLMYKPKQKESEDSQIVKLFNNKDYTYIPTTTISIDAEGVEEKERSDFEKPNLLTKWRINTMQGVSNLAEDIPDNRIYYLDSSIDNEKVTITVETDNETIIYETGDISDESKKNKLYKKDTSIEAGLVYREYGKIMFNDIIRSNRAEDNITVLFAHTEAVYEDRISSCKFGVLFGLYGNNDRLFISGSSAYPNMDFYSESNDYTYFPDQNYTILGNSNSSITGYSRVNDGSIAIHKGVGDTSGVYYRTSKIDSFTDNSTGAKREETVFPITAGAIGEHCISYRTCKRMTGDTLFLSSNAVCAVTLGNNAVINERYAKERSENISTLISHSAKDKSIAEVLDGRYYLFIGNKCYIADSRYRYQNQQLKDDTFNYEWWIWTLPGEVTATFNTNTMLLIGMNDGRIYTLGSDYRDVKYELINKSQYTIQKSINSIVVNKQILENWSEETVIYNGRIVKARKTNEENIKLYDNNAEIVLSENDILQAREISNNVSAIYRSGALPLGSNTELKMINKVAITSDVNSSSDFTINLSSYRQNLSLRLRQSGQFSFNNINFSDFTFGDRVFSNSVVKLARLKNVNYIKLILESNSNNDCVLNNIMLQYRFTKNINGGTV